MTKHLGRRLFTLLLLTTSGLSFAQAYPNKPIRFIVTQAPGGITDVFARLLAKKLGDSTAQPVIVDNRAGAEGIIGMEVAAKSPADGYAIVFSSNSVLSMNPSLYKKLPYDSLKDFEPVSLLGYVTYGLFINPSVPAKDLKEFIALAKSKPGQLNYGSGGSAARVGTEMFNQATGTRITFVPYKSNPAALTDLIGGQIDLMLLPILSAPQVKTGQLRALAIQAPNRFPQLPNIPTVKESGVSNFEFSGWAGIHAPAGVPKDRLNKLNLEIAKILAMPDVIESGRGMGIELQSSSPEQLDALVRADILRFSKAIKEAGITPD